MGYDLHIHRREFWADDDNPIPRSEWIALLNHDNTLVVDGAVSWKQDDGGSLETPTAEWTAPTGEKGYFHWYDGTIETKNPSLPVIKKAHELALKLSARVQGDDGEFYTQNGEPYDA